MREENQLPVFLVLIWLMEHLHYYLSETIIMKVIKARKRMKMADLVLEK
jgi:hypothetical protein